MGVDGEGFAGGDAEEVGVEVAGVVQEAAVAGVGGAGVVGVGVVEVVQVPAAVGGELGDGADPGVDQFPEFGGGGDAAGEPAARSHDHDRVVVRRGGGARRDDRSGRGGCGRCVVGRGQVVT